MNNWDEFIEFVVANFPKSLVEMTLDRELMIKTGLKLEEDDTITTIDES